MTQGFAITDATFAALKKDLDYERLTDLVLTIAFYNAVVRFLATMQIDNEPEYQQFLAEFPFAQD
jgi:alkylhydroperoxidase family enzyme